MYLRILYTDSSQRLCAPLTRTIWYCYDDRYVLLDTYVPSLDTHFLVRCSLVMGDDVVGDGVDHLLDIAHVDRARFKIILVVIRSRITSRNLLCDPILWPCCSTRLAECAPTNASEA